MKYEVNGRVCHKVEDALAYASRLIYVSPTSVEEHKRKLEKGLRTTIVYGFQQIEIRPVADTLRQQQKGAWRA